MADTDVSRIVEEIVVRKETAEAQLLQFASAMVKMQKSTKKSIDDIAIAFLKVIPKELVADFSNMLQAMAKGQTTFKTLSGEVINLSSAYATLSTQQEKYNKLSQAKRSGADTKAYTASLKEEQRLQREQEKLVERGLNRRATNVVGQNDAAFVSAKKEATKLEQEQLKLAERRAYLMGKELEEVEKLGNAEKRRVAEATELNKRLQAGTASIKEYVAALKSGTAINGKTLSPQAQSTMAGIQPGVVNRNTINQVAGVMKEIQSITKQSTEKVSKMVKEMFPHVDTKNIDQAVKKLQGFPSKISQTFRDIGNVIKGTLTAMLVFNVGQLFAKFFQDSYQAAVKFRGEMVQLNFAEAILSQKGMEITREELDGIIADIKEGAKYLSTLEVASIVGEVANMAAEFGITKDQMAGVSSGIAFMNMQAKVLGKEGVDAGSVLNALGDARSNFFNAYGINITKQAVLEKAVNMNLIKQGEAIDKNTARQAAYALFIEQTRDKQEEFLDSIRNTNPELAKSLEIQLAMEDIKLELGNQLISIKAGWEAFLVSIGGLEDKTVGVKIFGDALKFVAYILASIWKILTTLTGVVSGFWAATATGIGEVIILVDQLVKGNFAGAYRTWRDAGWNMGKALWEGTKAGWEMGGEPTAFLDQIVDPTSLTNTNTPTGILPPGLSGGEGEGGEDVAGALAKMEEEILSAQLKLEQDLVDAEIDLQRKLQDIDKEYFEKREEAWIDYQNKVAEINRDYAQKIEDINRSYSLEILDIEQKEAERRQEKKNEAIQKEKEYQNKMLKLREDFLMSLEDALHSRDARQILKLTSQYELDKKQAARDHALDLEQDAQEEAIARQKFLREKQEAALHRQQAIEDAEIERQRKLQDAELDRQLKMAELQRDEELEREAALLANQRKLEDLQKGNRDRLAIIAAGLVQEYKLTAAGLEAIRKLFTAYYGAGGYLSQVMSGMKVMLPKTGLSPTQNDPRRGRSYAQGGTMVANKPTTVTFGEAGLERATFTPMNRIGNDVNKVFSNLSASGGEGMGGKVVIELLVSPDLESRIVSNSLNQTAEIITRIQRSR